MVSRVRNDPPQRLRLGLPAEFLGLDHRVPVRIMCGLNGPSNGVGARLCIGLQFGKIRPFSGIEAFGHGARMHLHTFQLEHILREEQLHIADVTNEVPCAVG